MNKPWYNEPTPTTYQAILDTHGHWTFELRDRMENLERRLRHAERLLEMDYICPHCMYDSENIRMKKLRIVHLEAARQEDGQ